MLCFRRKNFRDSLASLLLGERRGIPKGSVTIRRELDDQLVGCLLKAAQGFDNTHGGTHVAVRPAYREDYVHGSAKGRRAAPGLPDLSTALAFVARDAH